MSQPDTSFLQINPNRLDVELIRQPSLYHEHADRLADAKLELDEAESKLDVIKAEVTLDIYERPGVYDLEKATKDTVEATLTKNKRVMEARKGVFQARHAVEILTSVVKALDQKKRALEGLVSLHGQDYFAEPRISGDIKRKVDDDAKRRHRRPLGRTLDDDETPARGEGGGE